ncbi:deoxynucleoside kinase [Mycetohabitans sp. B5]|uniref:Deoxyadenosine/deoxycytidine kinase n=1 Tax=Mycetohabitans endofungorum TaxID=417203 RepID=A0A2P5K9T3_9BURK|nr:MULTISPECIES: deoxynucleoside kinase [Mycetohabitans]MCG1053741.1 deoxynucleoside kinase [Mycetohabitans sp. B5]PPB83470.1 deoxyadenosine/deoxycytidine kinase [Mycetohabitans endofungorum]
MNPSAVVPPLTVHAPVQHTPFGYLVIEGPIGAGKTTLATQLATRWSMQTLLERSADNPFLERFYHDNARYALPAQLDFLLQRETQMRAIADARQCGTPLVVDFLPQKDELFARLALPDDEFTLYRALAARVPLAQPVPDLVIYLQASPETLFARIQKRAIPMQAHITDAYLRALCAAYSEFFYHYDDAPLLSVNTDHLDLAGSDADLDLLVKHIGSMRGRKAVWVKGTAL